MPALEGFLMLVLPHPVASPNVKERHQSRFSNRIDRDRGIWSDTMDLEQIRFFQEQDRVPNCKGLIWTFNRHLPCRPRTVDAARKTYLVGVHATSARRIWQVAQYRV